MVRLAEFVLRHRRLVMLFWLVMFVVGGVAAGQTSKRLVVDFSLPGQPGYETETQLLETFHNGGSNPPTIAVVTVPEGTTVKEQLGKITPVFDAVEKALPGTRMVDYAQTQDDVFLTDDGRTTYALVYPKPFESFTDVGPDVAMKPILEKASTDTGFDFGVTGYNMLAQGTDDPEAPSLLFETLLGGLGALAVLLFLFASFLAFVPLAHRSSLDPHDVRDRAPRHVRHRHLLRRAVPHRSRRPGRRGRLLVAGRQPLARGARARPRQPRRRGGRHELRRSRGGRQCGDRGHQPVCAARHPGAAAAQHGPRRNAHPAGQHRRHPHAAAGPPRGHRTEGRLAADPARGQAVPRLDRLGPPRRAVPLGGGDRRPGDPRRADHPDLRHQDRPGPDQLAGQRRRGLRPAPGAARRRRPRRHRLAHGGARHRLRPRVVGRAGRREGTRRGRRGGGVRPGHRAVAHRRCRARRRHPGRGDGRLDQGARGRRGADRDRRTSPGSSASPASDRRCSTTSTPSTRSSPTASG